MRSGSSISPGHATSLSWCGLPHPRPSLIAIFGAQDRGAVPAGFAPGTSWIPLVAALGMGVGIAQLAVVAAAFRAGRTRQAEALREVAIEHPRPGAVRVLSGLLALGGGVAMALVFSGFWAKAFAVLTGLLLAVGVGLLGRWLLGAPAAALARPLRALGAPGLVASTSLSPTAGRRPRSPRRSCSSRCWPDPRGWSGRATSATPSACRTSACSPLTC
jgi:hypothetical protein